jgi:hypothetical protein
MIDVVLDEVAMPIMTIVARHTTIAGRPAMGLKLLPMSRDRELRWARAIAAVAQTRDADALVAREPAAPARGAGEYTLVFRRPP